MRFEKVLMLGYSPRDLREPDWRRLEGLCHARTTLSANDPEVMQHLADTDCLLVNVGIPVSRRMINAAPNLKYIGVFGTGYGRIDADYAAARGVTVCNVVGYSTDSVAEFAFGLILEHTREIARAKSRGRRGNYSESGFLGYEIRGKKFGVIGLGRIGRRIAEIAHTGFGAAVSYWSRTRRPGVERAGIPYQEIPALLRSSDFVTISLAHVPETEGFLDADLFREIRPGAVVVHLAPAELLDLPALEERLACGDITFILDHSDDLSQEQARRLARYRNCVMYPSIGCVTREAAAVKARRFIENLESFLNGRPIRKIAQAMATADGLAEPFAD